MGASDEHIGSGTVPQRTDTQRWLLVKILAATNAGGGGGGGATWGYVGHYGGIEPNVTPTVAGATAKDEDPPYQSWTWNGTNWF